VLAWKNRCDCDGGSCTHVPKHAVRILLTFIKYYWLEGQKMIVIVNVWLTTEKTTIHALLSKDREFLSTILNIYFLSYVVQRLLNLILNLKKKRMEYPIKFFCWKLLKTISIKVKKITKNNFVQGEKNKKHANYICIMKRDWDSRAKECKKSNQ
jgi:hypothetical protein